nr:MAG TPA: hypothetical protein [Bacteriophage sp.]
MKRQSRRTRRSRPTRVSARRRSSSEYRQKPLACQQKADAARVKRLAMQQRPSA